MPKSSSSDEALLGVAQDLLSEFRLYPGLTLREAARGYIADHRKRMDPDMLKFIAACAIVAGDDQLAAIVLGRDALTGEELPSNGSTR